MIYGLYCIYDTVSNAYHAPIPAVNDNVAIRNFSVNFADEKSVFALKAEDFRLMYVGTFDFTTGEIVYCDPKLVIDGVSARNSIER